MFTPHFQKVYPRSALKDVVNTLKQSGIDQSEYTLVPGFFDESLTPAKLKELGIKKAALVYLDLRSVRGFSASASFCFASFADGNSHFV